MIKINNKQKTGSKWDDTDVTLLYLCRNKLHWASLVTGLASWGGLELSSDGLSLTSRGCSADTEPATRPQHSHIYTTQLHNYSLTTATHSSIFLPAIRLQAHFHISAKPWPIIVKLLLPVTQVNLKSFSPNPYCWVWWMMLSVPDPDLVQPTPATPSTNSTNPLIAGYRGRDNLRIWKFPLPTLLKGS